MQKWNVDAVAAFIICAPSRANVVHKKGLVQGLKAHFQIRGQFKLQ